MLRFTIDAKKFKKMLEKALTCISRKPPMPSLSRIMVQVEKDGIVKILGTDMDHTVEIRSVDAEDTSAGTAWINVDDLKVISKMTGIITLESCDTEKEDRINLKCGRRIVSIPSYRSRDHS